MHGCCNHIGCLSIVANRIGSDLVVDASKISSDLSASCKRIGNDLDIGAWKIGVMPYISCSKLNKGLKVTCSLVCTVNRDAYLRVEPDYVWLTPEMISGEFDIISNVSWVID